MDMRWGWMVTAAALLGVGCGGDCETGFAKANDGNCYPIEGDDDDDDDDDDDGPGAATVTGRDDTGGRGRERHTGRRSAHSGGAQRVGSPRFDVAMACPSAGQLVFQVDASVPRGAYAVVDVLRGGGAPRYEAHTLLPAGRGPGTTQFQGSAPSAAASFVDGASSELTCADLRDDALSWVVRVYDGHGQLWDCRGEGAAAASMVARSVETFGNSYDRSDLSRASCSVR